MSRLPGLFFLALVLLSCYTPPEATPLPAEVYVSIAGPPVPAEPPLRPTAAGGTAEEIRSHTESGIPSSLLRALEIIRDQDLGFTEFGRVMAAVNVTFLKTLYPAVQGRLPQADPPQTHSYSRILREAERGVYVSPLRDSSDYLEHVLPFLAYYYRIGERASSPEQYPAILPDLEKALVLNDESALAPYFLGIFHEYSNRRDDAFTRYTQVWEKFPECYPAALGLVRLMEARGRDREALQFLTDLAARFPDNMQITRELAAASYRAGDWSRAETLAAEILRENSRDGEFVLMRAHILAEKGNLLQAQALLDTYAGINTGNRLYLFLRARVQAEAYQNSGAALAYLRSILRTSPNDEEAAVYAIRLLLESSRPQEQAEGRDLFGRFLLVPGASLEVFSLALKDAIRREEWEEARTYLGRLLEARRSSEDLLAAYTVERAQGNRAAAFSYARELYGRDHSHEEGAVAYITAMIETGRGDEAAGMIEALLNEAAGGALKSQYYYLRSLTGTSEEMTMNDLRSSLFENPRNLDALIGFFEIYHRRGDERRALYYLKQALALAPNNLRLKAYEEEYGFDP